MIEAIILAAGKGKRLGQVGHGIPKCLLEIDGTTLLEKYIFDLSEAGIEKVKIITGYKADMIKAVLQKNEKAIQIKTYFNRFFRSRPRSI